MPVAEKGRRAHTTTGPPVYRSEFPTGYSADTDEAGHLFQPEAGRRSDLKPDAVPRRSRTAFRFEAGR